MRILKRILKIIGAVLLAVFLLALFFYLRFRPTQSPVWGVNFSANQARYLGLNPQEVFDNILADLHPKKIRLMAYWEDLEPRQGEYNFSEVDAFLGQAEDAGIKIILTLGRKQPRWPECHEPEWYKNLSTGQQRAALMAFISTTVNHFKRSPAIERWQVENEPYFNYGPNCPVSSKSDLEDEIALVKSLDSRPIVVTDSGEKGWWLTAAGQADIFGATMYRKVYNSKWERYQTYPLPPAWYRMRAGMAKVFTDVKDVIGVELQAEPWFKGVVSDTSVDDQLKIMDRQMFIDNINYAKATGLPEHYLWGVEWWYYMKGRGHGEFWEEAIQLFNPLP